MLRKGRFFIRSERWWWFLLGPTKAEQKYPISFANISLVAISRILCETFAAISEKVERKILLLLLYDFFSCVHENDGAQWRERKLYFPHRLFKVMIISVDLMTISSLVLLAKERQWEEQEKVLQINEKERKQKLKWTLFTWHKMLWPSASFRKREKVKWRENVSQNKKK